MPKILFYAGTAFCLFLALTSAAESLREVQSGSVAFIALQTSGAFSPRAPWAIIVALVAGLAAALIFVRMAALLAARNLFGAFLALFCATGAISALSGVLLLQWRMLVLMRRGTSSQSLSEVHLVGFLLTARAAAVLPHSGQPDSVGARFPAAADLRRHASAGAFRARLDRAAAGEQLRVARLFRRDLDSLLRDLGALLPPSPSFPGDDESARAARRSFRPGHARIATPDRRRGIRFLIGDARSAAWPSIPNWGQVCSLQFFLRAVGSI